MPRHFLTHAKQHGALLAKGRLLGVQFDTLFTDRLYDELGRHAIAMAGELRRILREAGCTFFRESPTNQQFVVLDNAQVEALAERRPLQHLGKARGRPHRHPPRHQLVHHPRRSRQP